MPAPMRYRYLTDDPGFQRRVLNDSLTPEIIKAKEESIAAHLILRDSDPSNRAAHQKEIDMLRAQLRTVGDDVTS